MMITEHANPSARNPRLSRREALELEFLIDIEEWCETHGIPAMFPFPAAMTSDLCAAIERIPFRLIGQTTPAQRSRVIFQRGAAALERYIGGQDEFEETPEFTTTFAAPLPRDAQDSHWNRLKLRCGPGDDDEEIVVTLGLDEDL